MGRLGARFPHPARRTLAIGVVAAVVGGVVLGPAFALTGGNRAAPSDNTITTLDPTVGAGSRIMTTVGSDGLGLVVYLAGPLDGAGTPIDPRPLKLAHCSNTNCTAAKVSTLATHAGQP